jgi:hypothetical protein
MGDEILPSAQETAGTYKGLKNGIDRMHRCKDLYLDLALPVLNCHSIIPSIICYKERLMLYLFPF